MDDDQGFGADVTTALRDVLRANAATPFRWDVATQGPVPLSQLQSYEVVIWATGESYDNTITAQDQATLRQYLQGGGKLIVTGQDVGFDIGTSDFYRTVLRTALVADSSNTTNVTTSGFLSSRRYTLNGAGSSQNQFYPDVIDSLNGSTLAATYNTQAVSAQSVRTDPNAQRARVKAAQGNRVRALSAADAGAIVLNDAGRYRTVTLGFGLEGLDPSNRDVLVKALLAWLLR